MPAGLLPWESTLDGILGWEVGELGEERASASFEVQNRHRQPFGLVHGGVYAALAEGLTSGATFKAVQGDGMIATGMSNNTTFLRPVTNGTVRASARRLHRGRTTWVWDVDFTNDEDRLCATSRVTIAVRPAPTG
jgi:1,4-dihydroxy-2-naphthoyl-CoA hydrolase